MSLKLAALYATTLLVACAAETPRSEPVASLELPRTATAFVLPPRPCTHAYRFTEVGADPESNSIAANFTPHAFESPPPYKVHAAYDAERARFVTADVARGVRAIDVRDLKRPTVSPVLRPSGHPEDLRVTADRALVVATVPNDDYARDISWLSLSPAPVRVVLQHKVLPSMRALYALHTTATAMTVVAVTDELRREPECTARTGTTLRQLEVRDDGIYEIATLDLGDSVDRITRSGDWLLVQEGARSHHPETARFVRIRNGTQELQASARYPVGGWFIDFHADGQSLRLVTRGQTESDRARHRLVGIARMETVRVASSGVVERIAVCEHTKDAVRERGSPALEDALYIARAVFTADRTLLVVHEHAGSASERVAIIDSKTCAATPFPGGIVVMPAGEQAAVLATANESRVLETRLYDLEQSEVQRASVRSVLKAESVPRDSRYRGYNAYLPFAAQVHTAGSHAWLAVPFRELHKGSVPHEGTQLFELRKTGPVLGPKLDGTLWIMNEQGRAVLRSPTGLQIVQLHEDGAPERIAALEL